MRPERVNGGLFNTCFLNFRLGSVELEPLARENEV